MSGLGFLTCMIPLVRELSYPFTIIIRKRVCNGQTTLIDYGRKVTKKDGVVYMEFALLDKSEPFPKDECITPQAQLIPLRWFNGKLVECTLVGREITWLQPTVDYSTFKALDSGELALSARHLRQLHDKYEAKKEKEDPLKVLMPMLLMLIVVVVNILGMMWILQNGGAEMYNSISAAFREGARVYSQLNQSVPIG